MTSVARNTHMPSVSGFALLLDSLELMDELRKCDSCRVPGMDEPFQPRTGTSVPG